MLYSKKLVTATPGFTASSFRCAKPTRYQPLPILFYKLQCGKGSDGFRVEICLNIIKVFKGDKYMVKICSNRVKGHISNCKLNGFVIKLMN